MPSRAEIGLGDLIKALATIDTHSPEEYTAISKCLGFNLDQQATTIAPSKPYTPKRGAWNKRIHKPSSLSQKTHYKPGYSIPPIPEPEAETMGEILDIEFTQEENIQASQDTEITHDVLQEIETLLSTTERIALPRQLLFPKKTARAIITESLMQPVPSSEIDIPKLIDAYSKLKSLKQVPYTQRLSVLNGCQLLLDFSESLMPWWEDMRSLTKQFHSVLSEQSCPIYEFDHAPTEAIQWTEAREINWQPVKRQPVIVATDLGHINTPNAEFRSAKSDWLKMACKCKKAEAPLIILNPLHHDSWDNQLSQNMTIIHWHPATTAANIKTTLSNVEKYQ